MSENEIKAQIISKDDNKHAILINLHELCKNISQSGFYNGGWIKIVKELDMSKTNGYSHVGKFVEAGAEWYQINAPVVFCDIGGSRKNQIKRFYLISIDENGIVTKHVSATTKPDYAPLMWDKITELLQISNNFNKKPNSINTLFTDINNMFDTVNIDLSKISTEKLIQELKKRNITIN